MNYSLRTHEKLSKVQKGDGIPGFDVTYEILRDGEPLGYHAHFALINQLNVNADPAVIRRRSEREQQQFERFAQLRAAYPQADYEEIMGRIAEEEVERAEREAAAELEEVGA